MLRGTGTLGHPERPNSAERLIEFSLVSTIEGAFEVLHRQRGRSSNTFAGDILNPEEGDQNKSALPRLPSGRLGAREEGRCSVGEGLFLIFVRFSSLREEDEEAGMGRAPSGIADIRKSRIRNEGRKCRLISSSPASSS